MANDDELLALGAQMYQAKEAMTPPKGEKGFLGQYVKPAVLPTAGSIAGAAFGGGVGTPFGMTLPGSVIGGGIGSGIGEAANQALGITEPSMANIGMAAAVPTALGAAATLARPLVRLIPTSRAAQTLNALAPEEAASSLARLQPKIPSKFLFARATAQNVRVPLDKTFTVVEEMIDDMTLGSSGVQKVNTQALSYLKGLQKQLLTNPSGLSPTAVQRELEGAGQVIKSIGAKGGSGTGSVKNVFKAIINDLDDVIKSADPSRPATQSLLAARQAFKREAVVDEMGKAIEGATKMLRGQGANVQFNANSVMQELGKNKFYKEAFSTAERGEIESLFKLLNKIPALRPGAGAQFGSGKVAEMVRMGSIGGGIGMAFGGAPGAAIGAAVGTLTPPVIEFGRNLAVALQMQTGRALMRELLTQSKGVATPQVMSVIGAYARAVEAGSVEQ